MRELRLIGLGEDGSFVVFADDASGEQFSVGVDDKLRGAVLADRARVGQLDVDLASRLSPREIQARIRGGESSDDVAERAGVSLERVLRFAGPVLAEREHMATQARRATLRRHGGDLTGHQLLEEAVARHLGGQEGAATWDSWRRPDGRWTVTVDFAAGAGDVRAEFCYDPLGRVVTPVDDTARQVAGEPAARADRPDPGGAARPGRSGRPSLAAVPDTTAAAAAAAGAVAETAGGAAPPGRSAAAAGHSGTPAASDADPAAAAAPGTATDPPGDTEPRRPNRPGRSRSRRGSVPSWDEILFGSRTQQR